MHPDPCTCFLERRRGHAPEAVRDPECPVHGWQDAGMRCLEREAGAFMAWLGRQKKPREPLPSMEDLLGEVPNA